MTDKKPSFQEAIDFLRSSATDTEKEAVLSKTIDFFHVEDVLTDLMKASLIFTCYLPQWWYRLGNCVKSADASCGPELGTIDHLLFEQNHLPGDYNFDDDHETDRNAHPARSLIIVMLMGMSAKASLGEDAPFDPTLTETKPPIWVRELSEVSKHLKWCICFTGMNEVIPTRSYAHAVVEAEKHNKACLAAMRKTGVPAICHPMIWPLPDDNHEAGLAFWESEGKS